VRPKERSRLPINLNVTQAFPPPSPGAEILFRVAVAQAKGARRLRRFRVEQSQGPCEIPGRRDSADGEAASRPRSSRKGSAAFTPLPRGKSLCRRGMLKPRESADAQAASRPRSCRKGSRAPTHTGQRAGVKVGVAFRRPSLKGIGPCMVPGAPTLRVHRSLQSGAGRMGD